MLGSNLDIMSPQWTDVIFKDRNQAYGAYQLRKNNANNTNRAVLIAVGFFVAVLASPTIANRIRGIMPKADVPVRVIDVVLQQPVEIQPEKKIIPPKVEKQVRSQTDVIKFLPPIVKPDPEAHEDPPTDLKTLTNDVGHDDVKGDKNAPIGDIDAKLGDKDVAGQITESNDKNVFIAVEIQPEFPGGEAAFGKFLRDHIRYPAVAKENGVQGRVFLQFVVERDGSLTDMQIIRNPGSGLGEEAARVLKITPHWKPGIQNGKPVRVQYTVPVNFSLAE